MIRLLSIASLALVALVVATTPASAQTTLGQTKPDVPFELNDCSPTDGYDEFQSAVESGTTYRVPSAGVITAWSTQAGAELGQRYALKLYRVTGITEAAEGSYSVVGHDDRTLTPAALNTFPVSIPVQPGDLLGTHVFGETESSETDCLFTTGLAGDQVRYSSVNAPDGTPTEIGSGEAGQRVNVSATLLTAPTVTALAKAKGSIKGGAKVTITGTEFASVSGVGFGTTPAKSFTVDSEGQITAVAPASKKIGKVGVTVTTAAGTATSATKFAYQGCKVPGLSGKKLKAAKKKLKKAGCKVGKLTKKDGATSAAGKVSKQSPKPGKVLAPGAKVKLTLVP